MLGVGMRDGDLSDGGRTVGLRRLAASRASALCTATLLLIGSSPLLAQVAPLGESGAGSYEIPGGAARLPPQNTLPDALPVSGAAPQIGEVERAIDAMAKGTPATPAELGRPGRVGVAERKRPLFDASPIRIPGFNLFVEGRASVTGDTNVLRRPGGSAEVYTEPSARIAAQSTWSRHSLRLALNGLKRIHATFKNENFWTATASAITRVDASSRLQLTGELRGGRDVDLRGSVGSVSSTLTPVQFNFLDATAGGRYQAGRFGLVGSLRYQKRDFLDALSLTGDPLDLQFRDAERRLVTAGVSYGASPSLSIVTSLRYDTLDYRISIRRNRDSSGLRGLLGVQGDLTALVRGHLTAGIITRSYADRALGSTKNLAYDAELEWLATELSTIKLTAVRDVVNSSNITSPVELRTTLAASIDHELLRNLIVSATAQHFDADYANLGQKDSAYLLVLSARWLVSPALEINGRVDRQRRRAGPSLNAFDFENERLTLGVRLRL